MQKNNEERNRVGDIKGGTARPKLIDNLFKNDNELLPQIEGNKTPIYIVGNLFDDYYFPISKDDITKAIKKLPEEQAKKLTHIWLRKLPRKSVEGVFNCQTSYICGNGINLIVVYPFPKDFKMKFGVIKPTPEIIEMYAKYSPFLIKEKHDWFLQWDADKIKKYYLHDLFDGIQEQMTKYHLLSKEDQQEVFTYYWGNRSRTNEL